MNKLIISTLSVLFSTVFIIPSAIAQTEEPNDTRIEKYEDLTQTDPSMTSQSEMEDMESMESEDGAMEPETRTEETLEQTQTDPSMTSPSEMEDMEPMESEGGAMEPETRTEETLDRVQSMDSNSSYDVRRTEAFNLVSSAYRGDFEDQGINSYAVLVTDYEDGQLTAEDLVQAAVDAGDLSPMALEDDSYIEAVDSQLNALTQS